MQKDEFIKALSVKSGYVKQGCEDILNSMIGLFEDIIKERVELSIRGFGQIQYKVTAEHEGNKPTKGVKGATERITIPETESVSFKLASNLKNIVKKNYISEEEESSN